MTYLFNVGSCAMSRRHHYRGMAGLLVGEFRVLSGIVANREMADVFGCCFCGMAGDGKSASWPQCSTSTILRDGVASTGA